jgi:hypothetical protein
MTCSRLRLSWKETVFFLRRTLWCSSSEGEEELVVEAASFAQHSALSMKLSMSPWAESDVVEEAIDEVDSSACSRMVASLRLSATVGQHTRSEYRGWLIEAVVPRE